MRGLPSLRALDEETAGGPRARIWLAREAQDTRCGFDRLAERVQVVIGQDPLSGHWFVFRSRRGKRHRSRWRRGLTRPSSGAWRGQGFCLTS
jgi:transposase